VLTVAHYFPDPLNRIAYYPGETFTEAQLAERGMTPDDISHHTFRGNFNAADTAAATPELGVESGLFLEASATGSTPAEPVAAAKEPDPAEPAPGNYTGEAASTGEFADPGEAANTP
jgi:hypothetical protein